MKKTAIIIVILTLISKVVGFIRDIILSYVYGAGSISDAYLIAYTIPGVIFAFVGTGIATSYIPIYNEILMKEDEEKGNGFTSNLINALFIFCSIVIILGEIYTYQLVKIFAAGFDNQTLELAVRFTRISLFGIYISLLIHIFTGFLNVKNSYYIAVFSGVPFNLIIGASYIFSKNNLKILPIGILIGLVVQFLCIYFYVKKIGFKYKFRLNLKDKYLKKIFKLSIPVIYGVSINEINVLVDRTIASILFVGGISILNYANRLNTFIQGIFVMSIATVIYPMLSKKVIEKDIIGAKKIIYNAIVGIIIVMIPIMFGIITFASEIVEILYGRGAFDSVANELTAKVLIFYSIGMLGFGLREIISRVFYSMQDTKTPAINASIGMFVNILLNLILPQIIALEGLALSTSISGILIAILLLFKLRKKIGNLGLKSLTFKIVKITFASIVMMIASKIIYIICYEYIQVYSFLLSVFLGGIIYCLLIINLKINEVDNFIVILRKKIIKSGKL